MFRRFFACLITCILLALVLPGFAAPNVYFQQVQDTPEVSAMKVSVVNAMNKGDPKLAMSEALQKDLGSGMKTVDEFIAAQLVGDISGISSVTVNLAFPTKYKTSDSVAIVFGIPNGGKTDWDYVKGVIESDGSVTIILSSDRLEALSGKTFSILVLSADPSKSYTLAGAGGSDSIIDNSYIKDLIASCPAIATSSKKTKDFYASESLYNKDFPGQGGIHTWKINIQPGVVAFSDDVDTMIVAMVPKGSAEQSSQVIAWEIKLLETISSINSVTAQRGIRLAAEMRPGDGDLSIYADSRGVIDLLDPSKYLTVLGALHDKKGFMDLMAAMKSLEALDTNGNGSIDYDEIFVTGP